MLKLATRILRIGMGLTFLAIGIMIWRNPELWGSFMQPWAQDLLISPLKQTMLSVAVFDMVIGLLLITGIFTWFVALLGALHLLSVIVVVGYSDITIRDFGLFTALVNLFLYYRYFAKQRKAERVLDAA